jgi:hypothetical protein
MSLPDRSGPADDRQLARYLLGLLPDQEAERLDEASIADDEVATRLRVVEDDLVDAYVSGTLSGELLERFESHYLASPRRRQNVQFARSFLRAIDRAAAAPAQQRHKATPVFPIEKGDAHHRTDHAPPLKLASRLMAAVAVLVVLCGVLLLDAVRLRNGLRVAHTESIGLSDRARELEQQLSEQRAANAAAMQELERVRESAAAPPLRSPQGPPGRLAAALVLLPQTRAVGLVPTIAISPGADSVAFELQLESNDFPRYQVALSDPDSNRIEWRSDPIAARSTGREPTLSVIVPARGLGPHHYSLALVGLGAASKSEVVGSYTFQVARR